MTVNKVKNFLPCQFHFPLVVSDGLAGPDGSVPNRQGLARQGPDRLGPDRQVPGCRQTDRVQTNCAVCACAVIRFCKDLQ